MKFGQFLLQKKSNFFQRKNADKASMLSLTRTDLAKPLFCVTRENQVNGAPVPVASSPRPAAQRNGVMQQDFQSFPSKGLGKELPVFRGSLEASRSPLGPPYSSSGDWYQLSSIINNFALCQKFSPDTLCLQVRSSTAYVLSLLAQLCLFCPSLMSSFS